MAGIVSLVRKTIKRGTNVVRRVGKTTRRTIRRGTNVIGLTKKRKVSHKAGRKSRRAGRR